MQGGLTHQQLKALNFIKDYTRDTGGVSPTYQEIATGIGLSSKAGVHRIVNGLEARGRIARSRFARSIMVLD